MIDVKYIFYNKRKKKPFPWDFNAFVISFHFICVMFLLSKMKAKKKIMKRR